MLEKFSFHFGLSSRTNQIAVAADKMETMPLEMYCSDHMIQAISTNSSKNPTKIACLTSSLLKSLYPFKAQYPINNGPAIRKRIEPKTNGEKERNASSIKKKVDPHTI